MYKFVAIIERGKNGSYSAYFPTLPGTAVVGEKTGEKLVKELRTLLAEHLHGMREDNAEIPASDEDHVVIEVSEAAVDRAWQ